LPYTPKLTEERAAAPWRVLAKDEAEDVLLAYAPKRARPSQSNALSDADLLAAVAKSLGEPNEPLPQDASGHGDKGDATPLSPAQASGAHDCVGTPDKKPSSADHYDERNHRSSNCQGRAVADQEIRVIEDFLRQLKRREPATPRPRGRNLMLGLAVVCVGAALACYYFVTAPSSEPTIKSQTASLAPSAPAMAPALHSTSSGGSRLGREPDWAPETSAARSDSTERYQPPAHDIAPEAPIASLQDAKVKPELAQEQAATASNTVRVLQPEEIRLLVQQGERFARDGDIVTARMIFERAAKTGDAAAALALAAAYDPIVLAKLGVLGIDTDVEKARAWYQKAQSLGAAEALERLNALASR
jgi:hypothetical protein